MNFLKRTVLLMLTLVLASSMMLSLVSCTTRLEGTYTSSGGTSDIMTTTYVFEGKGVKKSSSFLSLGELDEGSAITGTYDVDYKSPKVGYVITFVWDPVGSYANKSEEERSETFTFKKTNTYIVIDGKKFVKSES